MTFFYTAEPSTKIAGGKYYCRERAREATRQRVRDGKGEGHAKRLHKLTGEIR